MDPYLAEKKGEPQSGRGAIREKTFPGVSILRNQEGTALILALVMLVVLSILGAMSLSTTDTEIDISSNYRNSKEAFFAAERAIEYASTNGDIYTSIGTGSVNLNNTGTYASDVSEGSGPKTSGLDTNAANQVTYLSTGPLPPGTGTDPTYFESRYYLINATGKGPRNSSTRIEAQVARVVPK
jgi:type IV pilus assembly protein PilX